MKVGLEQLMVPETLSTLRGKKIGIVMNQTSLTPDLKNTYELLWEGQKKGGYQVVALFSPEHGLYGTVGVEKDHSNEETKEGIPVYNLFGLTKWSTRQLLEKVDLVIYDIQDIGCRSFTFATTLFSMMEEIAKTKNKTELLILDRPNPINGIVVDGPMVAEGNNFFASYINVPYCHGMTIGEIATYFNEEHEVLCPLKVIWMEGWKRKMGFDATGLPWIPLSPNVPSSKTALFYPMTGFIGEIPLVNNGIGSPLPFQVIGAPWLDPLKLKTALDNQKLPGVAFSPFHFKPMKGRLADVECQGLLIHVENPLTYRPVTTGFAILGLLKTLYPEKMKEALAKWPKATEKFNHVIGSDMPLEILQNELYATWKLIGLDQGRREAFLLKRKKYLYVGYSD